MQNRVHSGQEAVIPNVDAIATVNNDLAMKLKALEDRERILSAAADLYAEIEAFMVEVVGRTYAAYDAVRDDAPLCEALRIKHITALSIRDDYRRTTRENREDVALMANLRALASKASADD